MARASLISRWLSRSVSGGNSDQPAESRSRHDSEKRSGCDVAAMSGAASPVTREHINQDQRDYAEYEGKPESRTGADSNSVGKKFGIPFGKKILGVAEERNKGSVKVRTSRHQDLAASLVVSAVGVLLSGLWPGKAQIMFVAFYVSGAVWLLPLCIAPSVSFIRRLVREFAPLRIFLIAMIAAYPLLDVPWEHPIMVFGGLPLVAAAILCGVNDCITLLHTLKGRRAAHD
ncbi:hypothetical protein ACSHT0_17360 [Tepidicaulis sp. LMO-SS28]|uniref:hypothetical protein n=1 Tax=Tepidicaulis sp. LMO-SS28 TaxID=3447455 RepID=UPI003EE01342